MAMDSATIILMRWPSHTVQVTHMASPLLLEETAKGEHLLVKTFVKLQPVVTRVFIIFMHT
jgi:hypothetical protein